MPINKSILSDPRMRENYQKFLSSGNRAPLNVPGQDFNGGLQGIAGQMGKQPIKNMTRPAVPGAGPDPSRGYGGSGNVLPMMLRPEVMDSQGKQIQQQVRNPSTEQGGMEPQKVVPTFTRRSTSA
jgi:hypothetical protein